MPAPAKSKPAAPAGKPAPVAAPVPAPAAAPRKAPAKKPAKAPAHAPSRPDARVIAFMNQKGGVGKTTTVVNIAAGLAARGRSVLLVDMDPQGHSTLHLGVDPGSRERSVYDVLLDPEADPLDALVAALRPNLSLLPAEVDLAGVEIELGDTPDRNSRLTRALAPLKQAYEFILIDCPPSLGALTLNALAAAREVIVPMQAQFLALQGLSKLLETVGLVSAQVNPRLKVSGVVLCMHDENTRHSREVVADLENFFEGSRTQSVAWWAARLYRPAVRRSIKLAESPSFGQTIFEYAPASTGAHDYQELADELIREWDTLLGKEPPAGAGTPAAEPSVPTVVVREAAAVVTAKA